MHFTISSISIIYFLRWLFKIMFFTVYEAVTNKFHFVNISIYSLFYKLEIQIYFFKQALLACSPILLICLVYKKGSLFAVGVRGRSKKKYVFITHKHNSYIYNLITKYLYENLITERRYLITAFTRSTKFNELPYLVRGGPQETIPRGNLPTILSRYHCNCYVQITRL